MLGILIYIYFLFLGYAYSTHLFRDKDIYFRCWMGGVFGNVILMAGIVIPSLVLNFTVISHIVLIVLSAVPLIYIIKKYYSFNIKAFLTVKAPEKSCMDFKVFAAVVVPVALVICILMTNHILAPYEGGGVASGQCTFGDLQMHLGFVTSIAEQGEFPPNYAFLSGYKLNYPFFVNMLSSSLYLFGTPLRWAVLIPSYAMAFLIVMGFYILAFTLTKRKSAAVLATVLFFLNGGFGFAYFIEGAKADHSAFTRIFTDYYQTPTNFNEKNIRWANTICDMIIPQRTTMAGWCVILPAIWLLTDALKTKSKRTFIILGVLAGCMPMIHTHSFLALGILSGALFFIYLVGENNKKDYVINWVFYGAVTLVMALPQLFYWTFSQTSGNESFLNFQFNWVNHNDPYLWFYLKNWGIIALFAVPAIMGASKDNKKLIGACGVIFLLAELILFQPNEYDNNKLFFVVYMILVILVSGWLIDMWYVLKGVKGRAFIGAVVILAGTLSGVLTIGREYNSGAMYQTYGEDDIEMAEYIKENTAPDALFLTSNYHLNPVVSLAGRNIYLGSSLYVYFHGMGDEFYKRENELKSAYTGSYENLKSFCEEKGIDYIYIGSNENNSYHPSEQLKSRLELVHSVGGESLYKLK